VEGAETHNSGHHVRGSVVKSGYHRKNRGPIASTVISGLGERAERMGLDVRLAGKKRGNVSRARIAGITKITIVSSMEIM